MRQSFDSKPFVVRKRYTATLQRTAVLEWEAQVSHGLHLFCIIAAAVVARNVANQEVLTHLGPGVLGRLYMSVALVGGIFIFAVGWLAKNSEARRLARVVHFFAALAMVGAYFQPPTPVFAIAKYIGMDILFATMLLAFGVCLGARFEPREARRIAARVGAGGILGGLVAGAILSFGAPLLGSETLYLVAAGLAFAPIVWLPRARRQSTQAYTQAARGRPNVPALRPYGWAVAACTFLMVVATTLIDYQFRFAADRWFDADDITAFFGFVVLLAGGTTLLFQVAMLDRLLDRAGLFTTATMMPAALIASGAAFGLLPTLGTLLVLKLVDSGTNMSLQQATGSLLLAPLGASARSVWQGRIDGIAKRGAQALSGAFLVAFPWPPSQVLPLMLGVCGLWMLAVAVTRDRYVRLLTQMLSKNPKDQPELRLYEKSTGRLLEAELAEADANRAQVILQLLTRAVHAAPLPLLRRVAEADESGQGITSVMEHLVTLGHVRGLLELSRSSNTTVAAAALGALGELDPPRAELRCREILTHHGSPLFLQAFAAALLADSDQAAVASCWQFAKDRDPHLRLAVAEGLGRTSPSEPRISSLLAELAKDDNIDVARAAFDSMAAHPSPQACAVALATLQRHPLRNAAARALAAFGSPVVPPLAAQLADSLNAPQVASAIAWSLGRIASAATIAPLIDALRAEHVEVRLAAAVALTTIKRRNPKVPIHKASVEAYYAHELDYLTLLRLAQKSVAPSTNHGRLLRRLLSQRGQASLETLFRLWALHYPAAAIHGAFVALNSRDPSQRQLALELLDTILEPELRDKFSKALRARPVVQGLDQSQIIGKYVAPLCALQDDFLSSLAAMQQGHAQLATGTHGLVVSTHAKEMTMSEQHVNQILELQSVSIFSEASAEDLGEIASLLTRRSLEKGDVLFREGDVPDALYVLADGSIGLSRAGRLQDKLGPGDVCGIVAVLDRMPRELTAEALANSTVQVLAADDLWQLLSDRPVLVHSLFRALTHSIRGAINRAAIGKRLAGT